MMNEFVFYQPVRLYFGAGRLETLPEILKELGVSRAILVCDPFLREKAEELRKKWPVILDIFSEIEPNPQLRGAEAAAKMARALDAEAIIGMGGGSTMDTAKFAAATAMAELSPDECYERVCFAEKRLKVIAIPTTAGTGSEVTQVSVMSRGSEKRTINNPLFMPTAAIVDPSLTMTVPPRTTMNTGLDALAHALEGFWSVNHQPIADLFAVEAVRIIMENLETAWRDGSNKEARGNMLYASLLAGLAFSNPRTAGCHGCSYPLSEDYHLPHGEACAFTLDSFVRINADERLESLCRKAGLTGTDELAERIAALKKLAGLRTRLSDLGEVDMDKLCHDCAVHVLMNNNPVKMDEAALREMFEKLK